MKLRHIAILSTALAWSASAFALQETQCSNADGSIRRVEKEIFGQNPVSYFVNGQENNAYDLKVRTSDKRVLSKSGDRNTPEGETVTYVEKTRLARVDGKQIGPGPNGTEVSLIEVEDYLICKSWENSARD